MGKRLEDLTLSDEPIPGPANLADLPPADLFWDRVWAWLDDPLDGWIPGGRRH